jgi:hypothetical protein
MGWGGGKGWETVRGSGGDEGREAGGLARGETGWIGDKGGGGDADVGAGKEAAGGSRIEGECMPKVVVGKETEECSVVEVGWIDDGAGIVGIGAAELEVGGGWDSGVVIVASGLGEDIDGVSLEIWKSEWEWEIGELTGMRNGASTEALILEGKREMATSFARNESSSNTTCLDK